MSEEISFNGYLNVGGPVEQNTLHFVHRLKDDVPGAIELNNELKWSGDFERIKFLLNSGMINEDDIQFFLGYSGWGAGQLREELDNQSWFVRKRQLLLKFSTWSQIYFGNLF